jgi:polyisoprenoid-binding protein YceI
MTEPTPTTGTTDLLAASVGTWTVDPSASTVELHTKAIWGLVKVTATFRVIEGSAVVAADGTVTGTLVVDAASVDSHQAKRDEHLRGKDFFEVETYPVFTYDATGASVAVDGAITISGTMTIHGQTLPLTLAATAAPAGSDRVTVTAVADIDRSKWGLTWTKMGARVDNHVIVTAVFAKN